MRQTKPTETIAINAERGGSYLQWASTEGCPKDDILLQLKLDLQDLACCEQFALEITDQPIDPDRDGVGAIADALWLHDCFEVLRQPIRDVLTRVAGDIVSAARGDAFAHLWRMSLMAETPRLALRCLDRGAAALGERPAHFADETPLIVAATFGGPGRTDEVIRRLASAGHLLSGTDKHGRTALHAAAVAGRAETVRLLMELGADPLAPGPGGKTPLADARCFCPDARLPEIEAILHPIEWPAAAAAAKYRESRR